MSRYQIFDEDHYKVIDKADVYDRACALARNMSRDTLSRVRVSMNNKSGRILAAYKDGREVFYTYAGGREF